MSSSQPVEIEKKYLILYPDISVLERQVDYDRTLIIQTYIKSNLNGAHGRIRKRGKNGVFVYTKTYKRDITDMTRVEIEEEISKNEYEKLLSQRQKDFNTIEKERITFTYDSRLFELDIYPFWNDKAILEIELESENAVFSLPPFIDVIKDVTADKRFRNSAIARYGAPVI